MELSDKILSFAEVEALKAQVAAEIATIGKAAYDRQLLDMSVDSYNATVGFADDCPKCHGKAWVAFADYEADSIRFTKCKCFTRREVELRLKDSGLTDILETFTFDKFNCKTVLQQKIKAAAMDYVRRGGKNWFVILGQSGAGKTHICTAICGEFIRQCKDVRYFRWLNEGKEVKRYATDERMYSQLMRPYKLCDVLYIDDLFKRKRGAVIAAADISLAFEIIDYRIHFGKPTIISSEETLKELIAQDEAIGGRIKQQASKYLFQIDRDKGDNYRLNAEVKPKPEPRCFNSFADRSQPPERD